MLINPLWTLLFEKIKNKIKRTLLDYQAEEIIPLEAEILLYYLLRKLCKFFHKCKLHYSNNSKEIINFRDFIVYQYPIFYSRRGDFRKKKIKVA